MSAETLRKYVRQAETDEGHWPGLTNERARLKELEREVRELRRASEELQIAPSTYYAARSWPPSARQLRDEELKSEIIRIYKENQSVYGPRKVWRRLHREGRPVARSTVERLMHQMGLRSAVRGKKHFTTIPDLAAPRPMTYGTLTGFLRVAHRCLHISRRLMRQSTVPGPATPQSSQHGSGPIPWRDRGPHRLGSEPGLRAHRRGWSCRPD